MNNEDKPCAPSHTPIRPPSWGMRVGKLNTMDAHGTFSFVHWWQNLIVIYSNGSIPITIIRMKYKETLKSLDGLPNMHCTLSVHWVEVGFRKDSWTVISEVTSSSNNGGNQLRHRHSKSLDTLSLFQQRNNMEPWGYMDYDFEHRILPSCSWSVVVIC